MTTASNASATRQHCPATRKDGSPCQGWAGASGYCIGHTPTAHDARAKGGTQRSKAARSLKMLPERLRPVADLLGTALQEVYDGKLEPRQASAMASLASAIVRVVTSGEVEDRLRALEGRAATPQDAGDRAIAIDLESLTDQQLIAIRAILAEPAQP
jgi:hypothetical protein